MTFPPFLSSYGTGGHSGMEIWEMSEKRNISKGGGGGLSLFLSIILVFCILGIVVFSVAQKLSQIVIAHV